MKTRYFLFLLLFLVTFGACSDPKHVTEPLYRAEALMNEAPDSAWAVLNAISPDEMGQNRIRALYALLYTQAQDKTYRDETNDSLISVAVDYYRHTDDVRHKFLSFYYKGRVHFNANDYLNATSCYMEAEQLADAVGDDYLTGLLYAELGRIYRLYYDYPKSLEAYQKAAECYDGAGKIRHRNYMWLNLSEIYRSINKYQESEDLLHKALVSAREEGNHALVKTCTGDLVMLYIEDSRMSEAKHLYEEEINVLGGHQYGSSLFMGKLAKMYVEEGNFLRAQQCLDMGWKRVISRIDSVGLYFSSSTLLKAQGADDKAYAELMKGVSLQTNEVHQALQQPVLTAQRDYLSERLDFEAYKLRMEKHLRVLYILFFVLLLVMVVLFLSRQLKKEKEKARKTIDELNREILQRDKESRCKIESLLTELEDKDKASSASILSLRSELQKQEEDYHRYIQETKNLQQFLQDGLQEKSLRAAGMFSESMFTMGEILMDFDNIKAPNTHLESIIKQWKKNYFVGHKASDNLERLVNEFHDDAMYHFRQEIQLPNREDYRQVCYLFAGLSVKTIAWLVGKNENGLYKWRFRLREKLVSSDAAHKNMFIRLLGK